MRSRLRRFTDGLPPWLWPSRERRVHRMLPAARKWRRKHPPRCYRCGFDLTGSRHLDTCPECGHACEWGAHWTRDGRWSIWMPASVAFAGPMIVFLWWGGMRITGEFVGATTAALDILLVGSYLGFVVIPTKIGLMALGFYGSCVRTRRFRSLGPRGVTVTCAYAGAILCFWLGAEAINAVFPLD